MLTADLVDARRKDGELVLRKVDDGVREEALALAAAYLGTARAYVGRTREELEEAFQGLGDDATRRKLPLGLRKLTIDACVFEPRATLDPSTIRRALFSRASELRRSLEPGTRLPRGDVVAEVATSLGTTAAELERGLFSDLRGEQVLLSAPRLDARALALAWELGQAQAVLLSAVRITCDVEAASPGSLRAFFAKMKFHGLLFSAERTTSGFRVTVDGPFSLFEATTRYGLKLALLLPALRELERWSLVAELRWGKTKEALTFRLESKRREAEILAEGDVERALHLSDDARALLEGVAAIDGPWRARPSGAILDVPGAGVCIPDLELRRISGGEGAEPVYVELLGFWSRSAVFRRIELVERGLEARVVFALSTRLRVSAELLGDDLPASLYVFKTKPNARTLLAHVERVGR